MEMTKMVYIINDPAKIETKRELDKVALDRVRDKVELLRKIKSEIAQAQAWEKETKAEIKALLGDAEEGTVNGAPVVRWQKTESWAWAQFFKDNPGIARDDRFTKVEEVRVPNIEAIKAEHAGLLAQYQTRQFNIV